MKNRADKTVKLDIKITVPLENIQKIVKEIPKLGHGFISGKYIDEYNQEINVYEEF